jgi:hypothetical protein
MRVAELVMALAMAALSIAFMVKSAELPIGWRPGEGPGAGAFPFWLGAGMLICCIWIAVRWMLRQSPPSRSSEPYMDGRALKLFLFGAVPLTATIALIHVVGVYVAIPMFLAYYVGFLGRHPLKVTAPIVVATPVVIFLFFELALTISLPKGVTEPLFYPIFDLYYSL